MRLAMQYLGNAADADDAVQEAFVKVFAHMTAYQADRSFDAWFTRILVNACHDRHRSRGRLRRWFVPLAGAAPGDRTDEAWASAAPSADRVIDGERAAADLNRAVGRLPERQRQVFLLCHLDGQAPRDVAQALGVSTATVRVHLFRALRALRRNLEGWA
jgi:RNA polymerase sigma-70 factor (ECF subfamily)